MADPSTLDTGVPLCCRMLPVASLVEQSRQHEVDFLEAAWRNAKELNRLAKERETYLRNTIEGSKTASCRCACGDSACPRTTCSFGWFNARPSF